jgi:2-polyprenyl-3-methyl-5-hydroxy-6-metoxy-1,4-benzoquinol methylase
MGGEMVNLYNDLQVDIDALHEAIEKKAGNTYRGRSSGLLGLARYLVVKLLIKLEIYEKLVDAGILRGWFETFREYWQTKIGGRPISFHDFHYLRCHYRSKYPNVEVKEGATDKEFTYAWQRPENIYSTFDAVYKQALNPISGGGYAKYLKRGSKVLEYGCGIAPITASLIKYFSYRKNTYSIADIKGFPFHYAKFSLANYGVKTYNVEPYKTVKFDDKFDAIFIITVLEHLPDPDQVIKSLTEALERDGRLFFDYIISDGEGLDTKESLLKRGAVLDYIEKNYKIIKGKIDRVNSMGLTIAQKI